MRPGEEPPRKTANSTYPSSGLGYYCDLQSLHSEDAITWSVFGTVARAAKDQRKAWVFDFLRLIGLDGIVSPANAEISLWRRVPHPDEGHVPGGPEIDFSTLTENAVILGEAKWKSGVGKAQGKHIDKDQIQLRREFLEKYGHMLFPGCLHRIVVGVSLVDGAFNQTMEGEVTFTTAVWADACRLQAHPLHEEVERYYEWKVRNSQLEERAPGTAL
jgi:hypothetical protein